MRLELRCEIGAWGTVQRVSLSLTLGSSCGELGKAWTRMCLELWEINCDRLAEMLK